MCASGRRRERDAGDSLQGFLELGQSISPECGDDKHCMFLSLGYAGKISQMPVILTPLHFDRDPLQKQPSCQRSVVIRTFITSDFMTGIPATPGNEIPVEVIYVTSNIYINASYITQYSDTNRL